MKGDAALSHDVTEVIDLLRERGYLRRGPGGRTPAREHLRAWAAFLGGIVMLALAAALLGTFAESAAGWALVWLLLLPVAIVVASALAWMAMGASEWLHRRGHAVVRVVAGSAVAAALTATAGWVALIIDPPSPGPGTIAGAGVALVAGELLVAGGLARWITARLLLRKLDAVIAGPRLRTVLLVTLALALGGTAGVLALSSGGAPPSTAEPVRVRPAGRRLAILGIDGAARREILLARDLDGNGLDLERWAWAPLEDIPGDAELPVRWITLGTGLGHDRHGVTTLRQVEIGHGGWTVLLSPGLRRLLVGAWGWTGLVEQRTVPAALRRAPTVWEMASRAGVAVRVLGWWGSFPPRRVRGLVASERWLLTGERSPDTVFPVTAAPGIPGTGGSTPLDIDRRAEAALAGTPAGWNGLIMGYFPGWWLAEERRQDEPLLLEAARVRPHLELVGRALRRLRQAGFPVCLVGLSPHRPGWVMWSFPSGRKVPALGPADLVQTWLDALGLPPAAGLGGTVRRDLSGVSGPLPARPMRYGPPPPLAAHASRREGTAQLELLESLGYLR